MFHRTHDTIKGNLTIVFTALAISRTVQNNTALDVGNVIRQLRTQKPTPPETPLSKNTRPPAHQTLGGIAKLAFNHCSRITKAMSARS